MMRLNKAICLPYNNFNCEKYTIKQPAQFICVQFYDKLGDDDVPMNRVDNMLDCIRLKSEPHGAHNEGRSKGKCFALFTLYSTHGIVHIVRPNASVELPHWTVPHKKAVELHA